MQVDQVDQVERVNQNSTDSGGSAAGTSPFSAVTDTAGVSDIRSSAVSGGSAAGIHPVSAAAGGSDRIVDAAGALGNSSRKTSSGSCRVTYMSRYCQVTTRSQQQREAPFWY